jgi:hypothetical protein
MEAADVDANNETASSTAIAVSYNNDVYSNVEVKGNSGERFGQVLKEMAAAWIILFFRQQVQCYFNSNEI